MVRVGAFTTFVAACALSWTAASQENPSSPRPGAHVLVREAKLELAPRALIGADPSSRSDVVAPVDSPGETRADLSRLQAAAALYQKGDLAGGDALATAVNEPLQRVALEWIALKSTPSPDKDRLAAFAVTHPDWPAKAWFRALQEASLYSDRPPDETVAAFFAGDPPQTPSGKLALARAQAASHPGQAAALVRGLWRNGALDGWAERALIAEFGGMLTRADDKYRAERLLYAGNVAPALRAATLAGADELALAKLWASAIARPLPPEAFNAAPASLKADPALLYLRIQALRRADRVLEAALLLRRAPRDAAALIDGDRWWDERRMVARRLLDAGLAKDAYALCVEPSAVSIAARVDAEFHAGWIALRFLKDTETAARHFAAASAIAQTPLSIARAAYWRGRAAEQAGREDVARPFYERAAAFPIAYYGQLAAQKLHAPALALRAPSHVATGDARNEATRVIALLYAARLETFARPLAIDAARSYRDEAQLAALAQVVQSQRDALASVAIGKLATERGFALDESAFPRFGVPAFAPLSHSADLAMVYSVARQESEFAGGAASGAGAKGLMQILPSTARETAARAGVVFDPARLVADPAYNTQLGAAYLGQLLSDEGGSKLLALAAYNAGGARVQQWIDAYGDPRAAGVDPVDWVESIPFDETRDYVQRVYENLGVYDARFREAGKTPAEPQTGPVARADF
jgi:soluble lytic murein transglycosylase